MAMPWFQISISITASLFFVRFLGPTGKETNQDKTGGDVRENVAKVVQPFLFFFSVPFYLSKPNDLCLPALDVMKFTSVDLSGSSVVLFGMASYCGRVSHSSVG